MDLLSAADLPGAPDPPLPRNVGGGRGAGDSILRTLRALLVAVTLIACVPDVDIDESQLGAPRVLAVRGTPAEARPGEEVAYEALVADARGTVEGELSWAYCVARTPLAELGPVARGCVEGTGGAIVDIGSGSMASAPIPDDACRLFGPDPPVDEPGGRPVDADSTGGYRQPLRIEGDEVAIFEQRISCGVYGANQAQAAELTRRYRRNEAPSIDALEIVVDGGARALEGDIAPGVYEIVVRWPTCPNADACGDAVCGVDEDRTSCAEDCDAPRGCGGAERYLRFDLATRTIVEEREALRVAWYVSGGELALERTGVASDEAESSTSNELTIEASGDVVVIAVVRDERGGVAWRSGRLRVE
jgi:hypothetical protein